MKYTKSHQLNAILYDINASMFLMYLLICIPLPRYWFCTSTSCTYCTTCVVQLVSYSTGYTYCTACWNVQVVLWCSTSCSYFIAGVVRHMLYRLYIWCNTTLVVRLCSRCRACCRNYTVCVVQHELYRMYMWRHCTAYTLHRIHIAPHVDKS